MAKDELDKKIAAVDVLLNRETVVILETILEVLTLQLCDGKGPEDQTETRRRIGNFRQAKYIEWRDKINRG